MVEGTDIVDLSPLTLEFVNGFGGAVYAAFDLGTFQDQLFPGEYLVLDANVLGEGAIQNGPDGLRIVDPNLGVIDGLAYEGGIDGAGEGPTSGTSLADAASTFSLCRIPNGVDTDDNQADFSLCELTPGFENIDALPAP